MIRLIILLMLFGSLPALALVDTGADVEYVPGTSSMGIGVSSPNAKLTINGGMAFREIATQGATLNYGKLYANSSNHKLYFKDNGGVAYNLVNGSSASSSSAAGSDTYFQFNNGGNLGGNGALSFTKSTKTLLVPADAPLDINSTTVSIADTNIALDGASTTFSSTGALSLISGGTGIAIQKASPSYALDVNGTTFSKAWNFNGNSMSIGSLSQGSILFAKVGGSLSALDNGASSNRKILKINGNTLAWENVTTGDVTGGSSSVVNGLPMYTSTTGKAIRYSRVNLLTRSAQSLYIGNGSGAYTANGTTLRNTALGFNAMRGGTSFTGDNNVALGINGLLSITSGYDNIALGYNALRANTAGNGNIAIGNESLRNNTTGGSNIGFGYQTLRVNTTGSYNIAMGYTALWKNTTGSYNIAMADSALFSNTTGSDNIALGLNSMVSNTTASYNIGIGYQALNENRTENNNVALGYSAGRGNAAATSYSSSVFLGRETGLDLTNGNGSVMVGYQAGTAVTTGNGNLLLGYQAGDAITTGARNIVIGYDIDAPSATGRGQLSIGNLIYGNGLTATSGTTVSGGKVGINKGQPAYTLDINGTTFSKAWNFNGNSMSVPTLSQGSILFAKVGSSLSALDNGASSDHKVLKVNGNTLAWESLPAASSGDVTGGSSSVVNGLPMYTSTTGKAIGDSGVKLISRSQRSIYIGNGSGAYTANGTSLRNTALGYDAMKGGTSFTGDNNVAVGMNGLMSITSGADNVVLGYNSLRSITSGSQNIAIGANNINTSTGTNSIGIGWGHTLSSSASRDIAIGYQVLRSRTTGNNNNVGLGYQTLYNTTTSGNNCIGYQACYSSTSSGSNSLGFGYQALYSNTTQSSLGMGYRALYSNTSGTGNIGLGTSVLYYNATGSDNTASGSYAGEGSSGQNFSRGVFLGANTGLALTKGNGNVMIGYSAGTAVTSGNGNLLLGYQAGDAISTGARNIVIGYDIDALSSTGRGQLTIGNLIYGNGLTATSGTTVSSGKVGINKAQPSYTLDVNGTMFVKNLIVSSSEYDTGNSGATPSLNWNNGNQQLITLTANVTTFTWTAPPGVGNFLLRVVQGGSGSYTISWPAAVKWPSGTPVSLNSAVASETIVSCYYNGTNYYCQSGISLAN